MRLDSLSTGARIGGLLGTVAGVTTVVGFIGICTGMSGCRPVSSRPEFTWSESCVVWGAIAASGLIGACLGGVGGHVTEATVKLALRILIKH